MQKTTPQFIKEALLLLLALVVSLAFALFLSGKPILNSFAQIHLYDAYFVISKWQVVVPLSLFPVFLFYFFRTTLKKSSIIFANRVMLVSGLALIIFLTMLIGTFSHFLSDGLTIYPPLSALDENNTPDAADQVLPKFINNF